MTTKNRDLDEPLEDDEGILGSLRNAAKKAKSAFVYSEEDLAKKEGRPLSEPPPSKSTATRPATPRVSPNPSATRSSGSSLESLLGSALGRPLTTQTGTAPKASAPTSPASPSAPPAAQPVDEEFRAALQEDVDKANTPGYTKFRKDFRALARHIPNPTDRCLAAYETAREDGVSVPDLVSAIKARRAALEKARSDFGQMLDAEAEHQNSANGARLTELDAAIAAEEEAIAKAQQRLGALKGEKQQITESVDTNRRKLDMARGRFSAAADSVAAELQDEEVLITTNLANQA